METDEELMRLRKFVEELCECTCCGQKEKCLEGCTLFEDSIAIGDAYSDFRYGLMCEARKALYVTPKPR